MEIILYLAFAAYIEVPLTFCEGIMDMMKTWTRILSGHLRIQKGDIPVITGNRGGLKVGEQRREPSSGLDKLNVVLNPPRPDPQRALAGGRTGETTREASAATKIQAAYRGHLVRRSVRTHKSLVKVQALVRGHIVRRQAANALVRVQARARANAVRKSAAGMKVQQRLEAVGYRQKDGPGKKRSDLVDKDPEEAIAHFWKAIKSNDRVDSALKGMAIVMKQQGRSEEAIEAIRSLRSKCSEAAQESLDNVLLDLYTRCGRFDDQIELLKHKLNLIHQGLAFNGKRTKTARSQKKKFQVSIEQEATRLLKILGWAYMQQNNFLSAEAVYRKALSIEPDNNKMCKLGICLMKQDRIDEARAILNNVTPAGEGKWGSESHQKSFERAQEMLREIEATQANQPAPDAAARDRASYFQARAPTLLQLQQKKNAQPQGRELQTVADALRAILSESGFGCGSSSQPLDEDEELPSLLPPSRTVTPPVFTLPEDLTSPVEGERPVTAVEPQFAVPVPRHQMAPPQQPMYHPRPMSAPLQRQESGAFPAKVVEREEPILDKDPGEQRTCKWCGRLSTRVKDTEAGPLCGVCQLTTATATRLNKDPYSQTGTKVDSPTASGSRTKSVPSPLSLPRKKATPSPTAAKAERRQSFHSSSRVRARVGGTGETDHLHMTAPTMDMAPPSTETRKFASDPLGTKLTVETALDALSNASRMPLSFLRETLAVLRNGHWNGKARDQLAGLVGLNAREVERRMDVVLARVSSDEVDFFFGDPKQMAAYVGFGLEGSRATVMSNGDVEVWEDGAYSTRLGEWDSGFGAVAIILDKDDNLVPLSEAESRARFGVGLVGKEVSGTPGGHGRIRSRSLLAMVAASLSSKTNEALFWSEPQDAPEEGQRNGSGTEGGGFQGSARDGEMQNGRDLSNRGQSSEGGDDKKQTDREDDDKGRKGNPGEDEKGKVNKEGMKKNVVRVFMRTEAYSFEWKEGMSSEIQAWNAGTDLTTTGFMKIESKDHETYGEGLQVLIEARMSPAEKGKRFSCKRDELFGLYSGGDTILFTPESLGFLSEVRLEDWDFPSSFKGFVEITGSVGHTTGELQSFSQEVSGSIFGLGAKGTSLGTDSAGDSYLESIKHTHEARWMHGYLVASQLTDSRALMVASLRQLGGKPVKAGSVGLSTFGDDSEVGMLPSPKWALEGFVWMSSGSDRFDLDLSREIILESKSPVPPFRDIGHYRRKMYLDQQAFWEGYSGTIKELYGQGVQHSDLSSRAVKEWER